MSTHSERVSKAFAAQAAAFEDASHNHLFTTDAAWLFEPLLLDGSELLLDVAAGTGHAARELAPRVRVAVALDLTPAMLEAGKAAAERSGVENVVFMRGEASALPFLDGSFDVVVTRFALHHVEHPRDVLAEIVRCVRPGGQIGIADMLADDDETVAQRQNRLEQARDPSHAGMLSAAALVALLDDLGLQEIAVEAREIDRPLAPWLGQASVAAGVADAIRRELREEIAGGAASGFQPYERDGELRFVQRWGCALAHKP
ncbi:MAG TPA: class I SAM-dependent methyltransferase [Solirubrobacteraceae bacterium]|jgi:ubiquinone/menaquinone biosynthesis C-methylase UbiE|nr:class I SAM-dependent methyltransferase [Solirubrobacteraceae bacterium]